MSQSVKFNPDVINDFEKKTRIRNNTKYEQTTNLWKGIIGSINKQEITSNDLKIKLEPPNHIKILNDYNERNKLLDTEKKEIKEKQPPKNEKYINTSLEKELASTFNDLKTAATNCNADNMNLNLGKIDDIIARLENM